MAKDDVNTPIGDRLIIPASSYRIVGPDAEAAGAQEVLASNADRINNFIEAQRRAVHLSTLSQHKAFATTDDLDITYLHQFGQERVTFEPRVAKPEPPPEPLPPPPPPEVEYEIPVDNPSLPCLLVLYGSEKVAAFDMGSLTPTSATLLYQGNAPRSNFSEQGGNNFIRVFQTGGWIQTGCDLTGSAPCEYLMITDTNVIKATSTQSGRIAVPVMALTKETIYTSHLSFDINNGALEESGSNTGYYPYCIDSSGTCYYLPTINNSYGQITFNDQLDIGTLPNQVNVDISNASMVGVQTADVYEARYVVEQVETTNIVTQTYNGVLKPPNTLLHETEPTQTHYYSDTTTSVYTLVCHCLGFKTSNEALSFGNGYAYAQSGSYSQTPTYVFGPQISRQPTSVDSYDISLNQYAPLVGDACDVTLGGSIARQIYDPSNGLSVVSETCTMVSDASITAENQPGVAGANIPGNFLYEDNNNAAVLVHIESDYVTELIEGQLLHSGLVATPPHPTTSTGMAAYAAALVAAEHADEEQDVNGSTVTLRTTTWRDDGYGLNSPLPAGSGSVSGGDPASSTAFFFEVGIPGSPPQVVYQEPHIPQTFPTTVTSIASVTLNAWNQTAHGGTSGGAATLASIVANSFPPGNSQTPYVVVVEGSSSKVVTPFSEYTGSTEVEGWVHAESTFTNHWVQGYRIDADVRYLKMDGQGDDGNDFADFLVKVLKCQKQDIKAVYMDIPLYVIVGLHDITFYVDDGGGGGGGGPGGPGIG